MDIFEVKSDFFALKTKVVINSKFEFLNDYIHQIPAGNADLGEIIYSARNTIYRNSVKGIDLTVKCFKTPSFFNRIVYTYFRESKAKRSYENAVKLTDLSVGTPTPIAYIEIYKSGLIEKSFYICGMLDAKDIRWWDKIENNDILLGHLGNFIASLHSKGVFHKDFSPGNILYDANFNFYLIDINRMSFNVYSRNILMQNFKCLHDSPEETARLAAKYAVNYPADESNAIINDALNARKKYKSQQAFKRRIKNLVKFRLHKK